MPTPTIVWNVDADGDWGNPADWDLGRIPDATDDVLIDTADPHTVTHGSGTDTASTLTVGNDAFVVSGGSLTIEHKASFAGLLTVSGGALAFDGDTTVASFSQGAGTVSGSGTLVFGAGTQALNSGAILTVANWAITNGATTFVNEILSYAGALYQRAGTSLAVAAGDKLRLTGDARLDGVIGGAGTLTFAGGTQAVNDNAIFNVANWVISNDAVTTIHDYLSYAGAYTQAAGATVIVDRARELSLTGTASLAGTIGGGAGVLSLAGGTQALNAGATLTIANWWCSGNAVTTLNESLTYAGTFIQDPGASLNIAAGDKLRFTGGGRLDGSVGGAGTLTFAGSNFQLETGVKLTVANWVISNNAQTSLKPLTSVKDSLTYGGAFVQAAGCILTIDLTLSLSGPARLAGLLWGFGEVELSNATLSGLTVGQKLVVNDVGTVDQTGAVTLGVTKGRSTLSIRKRAIYSIDNDSGIVGGEAGASTVKNEGLFIKSGGTGTSAIGVQVTVTDIGVVEAASGTLDFTQAILGEGTLRIDAEATLEADASAASTLTVRFLGGSATLALARPAEFAATLHGFAATDTIDLLGKTADAATLGAGDTLVIKNGANTVATLQLGGDYTAATFHLASDGHGGTNVTVTPGPARQLAVAGHQFIAAMAGFGAGAAGPTHMASEVPYACPTRLSIPRMAMA